MMWVCVRYLKTTQYAYKKSRGALFYAPSILTTSLFGRMFVVLSPIAPHTMLCPAALTHYAMPADRQCWCSFLQLLSVAVLLIKTVAFRPSLMAGLGFSM